MEINATEKIIGMVATMMGIAAGVGKLFQRSVKREVKDMLLEHNQSEHPHANTIVGRERCDNLHALLNTGMNDIHKNVAAMKNDIAWIKKYLRALDGDDED